MSKLSLACPVCQADFSKFRNIQETQKLECPACSTQLKRLGRAFLVDHFAQKKKSTVARQPYESYAGVLFICAALMAAKLLTPLMRGELFLLLYLILGVLLFVISLQMNSQYVKGTVLWPFLSFLCLGIGRIIFGLNSGMHRFQTLIQILIVGTILFVVSFSESGGGGSNGSGTCGSSCGSSCSSCGGGCGSGCGGCGS